MAFFSGASRELSGLGNLQDHPDYWEEAESFDSLHSNLYRLHFDLTVFNVLKDKKAA
jgi:hypothetical protein